MGRLKNAWWALRGVLPAAVVEQVEVGAPEPVRLYEVRTLDFLYPGLLNPDCRAKVGVHYLSCEDAFLAVDGDFRLRVEEVRAVRIGRKYYRESSPLKVFKPKIPKGKRNGR